MSYGNVQNREDRTPIRRKTSDLWHAAKNNPYFWMAAGLGAGFACLLLLVAAFEELEMEFAILAFAPLIAAIFLVLYGVYQFRQRESSSIRPVRSSDEKQLLIALRDAGGSITPVQAALETSLSVDDAEQILSRLAERGHLLMQSHDGALYYALPGRRGLEGGVSPSG